MRLWEMIYTEEELQQEIRAKESWRDLYREQLEKNKKLKEENRTIRENSLLWQATMEEAYNRIEQLEKENKNLKEDILFRNNRISWFEWEEERLNSVINTLKKKLENSVWFWKKKVAKLSEENRQLKHRNEVLDLSLKASVHPLVYNELVWNTETSKSTEWRNS